jgi:hypothetical protein
MENLNIKFMQIKLNENDEEKPKRKALSARRLGVLAKGSLRP